MTWANDRMLSKKITEQVRQAAHGLERCDAPLLNQVSDVTASLLKWWFQDDRAEWRAVNFHEGQRQAILSAIYAHEVLKCDTLFELYAHVAPQILMDSSFANDELKAEKHDHRKYCLHMATGTGKTWVLQALMLWQILNAKYNKENPLFTRNFLIVTPGLIVYDRMLDAFLGKERDGKRDFATSDLAQHKELFIPYDEEDYIFSFVRNAICPKEDIGSKVTGGGVIAITNWHLLSQEHAQEDDTDEDTILAHTILTQGMDTDYAKIAQQALPLSPGKTQGNELNRLNRQFEGSHVLDFLKSLPNLMVFNDEAHHIHSIKKDGEASEVEWQKSLLAIAQPKREKFFQVDFSATPYNQTTTGNKKYFPHIITDFDLITALQKGLVKSLVLDKRKQTTSLEDKHTDFKAERDEKGKVVSLGEGQRIMLRAGLTKLEKLEKEFADLDPDKRPKMMVMCEDTSVTPFVEEFLLGEKEILSKDELLRVDSTRKGELKQDEWNKIRERLFDIDSRKHPRIIISVLMLREGFDVNNVCVIVPLRATGSQILLEQTIGRGLRLMWREHDYDDTKKENRELIRRGEAPTSLIDVLTIVEHPAFMHFYDQLMQQGLLGQTGDADDRRPSTGDLITVGLINGYEKYDFAIPFIQQEKEEVIKRIEVALSELRPCPIALDVLQKNVKKGEQFVSQDVQTKTTFGDYSVKGGVMTATGYNDYLARMVTRVSERLSPHLIKSARAHTNPFPYMQIDKPQLAGWLDNYIKQHLFKTPFNPLENENWRILCVDAVATHIIRVWVEKLVQIQESATEGDEQVIHRCLSEVKTLTMRKSASLKTKKCIYERLGYSSHSGGLEKIFMEACMTDSTVKAFCKIDERKHNFLHLRYIKDEGMPSFYSPDFLVRCDGHIFLVETKAQAQMNHPDVRRKQQSAITWCERINGLTDENKGNCKWAYALLGEQTFHKWLNKGGNMFDLLKHAKLIDQAHLFDEK